MIQPDQVVVGDLTPAALRSPILASVPAAMQLRYLQTLTEIGAEQNSTVVFPMPIDIIKPFLELFDKTGKAPIANGASRSSLTKEVSLGA